MLTDNDLNDIAIYSLVDEGYGRIRYSTDRKGFSTVANFLRVAAC